MEMFRFKSYLLNMIVIIELFKKKIQISETNLHLGPRWRTKKPEMAAQSNDT